MPGPSLSVCMIVKNEERHLVRCLESVRGLADEVVIADTGSTDATVSIAERFGARVLHFAWCDDFSAARNFSLDHATGDWVLVLDADETIASRDHAAIRADLRRADADMFLVAQRHYLTRTVIGWQSGDGGYEEGSPYAGYLDIESPRLFRNEARFRYRNRVHEVPVSVDPERPARLAAGAWVIHHFGKVADAVKLRAKEDAYVRIGRRKLAEHPDDPQAHYELGVQYAALGRHEEAFACFEGMRARWPGFRDLELLLAASARELRRYDEALQALQRAARAPRGRELEIAFEEGVIRRELGDDQAAEEAFRRCLALRPDFPGTYVNLAVMYERQQRADDVMACLDRAVAMCPRHDEIRLLRASARRAAGDEAGALADLEVAGAHPAALRMRARLLARQSRFQEAARVVGELAGQEDAELELIRGAVALGLSQLPQAIRHLRRSLELQPTYDAARNLSTALAAAGDDKGALAAAAQALSCAPDNVEAQQRFQAFAGRRLRTAARGASDPLTVFVVAAEAPESSGLDGDPPAAAARRRGDVHARAGELCHELRCRGHRLVVFGAPGLVANDDGVALETLSSLPLLAVQQRPDAIVAVGECAPIARLRLAPLQIHWVQDDQSRLVPDATEIDLVAGSDGTSDVQAATAAEWETVLAVSRVVEPPPVERVAVHLSAGRTGLALRMARQTPCPGGIPADAWMALQDLVAWHAGERPPVERAARRLVALWFPSLRRIARLDSPVTAAKPSAA